MYVYSDIVELSRVGYRQLPIMGFLPITSKFQESGHWVVNSPMYVRVREKNIRSITIRISTETGEVSYSRRCGHLSPQLSPPTIFGLDLYKEQRHQV